MPLAGRAVLAIWNGIAPEAEAEFVAWHVREHIPERVGLPGFLRGRRYVAVDAKPKYFNFYETEHLTDLSSQAYQTRLDAPTPWTRSVVAHFTDTSRTICNVELSLGQGDGGAIMPIKFGVSGSNDACLRLIEQNLAPELIGHAGIVGVHVLRGDDEASRRPTQEMRLRSAADDVADWILMVEAARPETLLGLRTGAASRSAFEALGAVREAAPGVYAVQFTLSKSQLSADAGQKM